MKRRCKRTVKSFVHRYTTSTCRKSLFYKNRADSLSLSPNPFPLERGYFAGATAPSPCWGLHPSTQLFDNNRGFSTVCNFLRFAQKIPHRPEQRTMGAKRNKQTAKKAQSKTPKRRRSLLLAGTAPERQTAG